MSTASIRDGLDRGGGDLESIMSDKARGDDRTPWNGSPGLSGRSRCPRYGDHLIKAATLPSGTLCPLLARWRRGAGGLRVETPRQDGQRRRRYYRLTSEDRGAGLELAQPRPAPARARPSGAAEPADRDESCITYQLIDSAKLIFSATLVLVHLASFAAAACRGGTSPLPAATAWAGGGEAGLPSGDRQRGGWVNDCCSRSSATAATRFGRLPWRGRGAAHEVPSPLQCPYGDQGGKPGPFGMMDVPHSPAAPTVQVNVRPTRGLPPANPDRASDDGRIGGLVGQLAAH